MLAALIFIPYCLHRLGSEAFGILTLIWALIGYFSLFDFGVGRALTCEIGRRSPLTMKAEIVMVMRAGVLMTLVTGVLGAGAMWLLAPYLAGSWLAISPDYQSDATQAFQLAAVGVLFATMASALRGAQEGLEQFRLSNINKLVLGFCTFTLPALAIYLQGPLLTPVVLYLVLARGLIMLINVFQLRTYLWSDTSGSLLAYCKSLYSFGAWVTVSGVIGPLMVYGDRFFVSAAVGANFLPLYAIPQEGLQRLLLIPGSFCGALLPRFSGLAPMERKALFLASYKRVALVMLGICVVCAMLAYPALSLWLSSDFARDSIDLVLILIVGIWINSVAMVPFTFLHAAGLARLTALFHVFELVVYVVTLFYLVREFGLVGAALAWVLRVTLDWILLHWSAVNNDQQ